MHSAADIHRLNYYDQIYEYDPDSFFDLSTPVLVETTYPEENRSIYQKPIGSHSNLGELKQWWSSQKSEHNIDYRNNLDKIRNTRQHLMKLITSRISDIQWSATHLHEKPSSVCKSGTRESLTGDHSPSHSVRSGKSTRSHVSQTQRTVPQAYTEEWLLQNHREAESMLINAKSVTFSHSSKDTSRDLSPLSNSSELVDVSDSSSVDSHHDVASVKSSATFCVPRTNSRPPSTTENSISVIGHRSPSLEESLWQEVSRRSCEFRKLDRSSSSSSSSHIEQSALVNDHDDEFEITPVEIEGGLQRLIDDSVHNLTWATKTLFKYRSLQQSRQRLVELKRQSATSLAMTLEDPYRSFVSTPQLPSQKRNSRSHDKRDSQSLPSINIPIKDGRKRKDSSTDLKPEHVPSADTHGLRFQKTAYESQADSEKQDASDLDLEFEKRRRLVELTRLSNKPSAFASMEQDLRTLGHGIHQTDSDKTGKAAIPRAETAAFQALFTPEVYESSSGTFQADTRGLTKEYSHRKEELPLPVKGDHVQSSSESDSAASAVNVLDSNRTANADTALHEEDHTNETEGNDMHVNLRYLKSCADFMHELEANCKKSPGGLLSSQRLHTDSNVRLIPRRVYKTTQSPKWQHDSIAPTTSQTFSVPFDRKRSEAEVISDGVTEHAKEEPEVIAEKPLLINLPLLLLNEKSNHSLHPPFARYSDSFVPCIYFYWDHNLKQFGLDKRRAAGIYAKIEMLERCMKGILTYDSSSTEIRVQANDLSRKVIEDLIDAGDCAQVWPRTHPVDEKSVKFLAVVPDVLCQSIVEENLREGLYYLRNIMQSRDKEILIVSTQGHSIQTSETD